MPEQKQEKRCGTCLHLSVDWHCCVDLPFWAIEAEGRPWGFVFPDQGTDCDAWTSRPEKQPEVER